MPFKFIKSELESSCVSPYLAHLSVNRTLELQIDHLTKNLNDRMFVDKQHEAEKL